MTAIWVRALRARRLKQKNEAAKRAALVVCKQEREGKCCGRHHNCTCGRDAECGN